MLIFYLFKITRKVMKIIYRIDFGMLGESEGFVSKERNVNIK